MPSPPLDPSVADEAPRAAVLTGYDQEHLVSYLRVLDADAETADWAEVVFAKLEQMPVGHRLGLREHHTPSAF